MSLPDKIRYDSIMVAFIKPTPEDLATNSNGAFPRSSKPERPAPPSFASTKYVQRNIAATIVVVRGLLAMLH